MSHDDLRRNRKMVVDRPHVERIKVAEKDREQYAAYYECARRRVTDFIRQRSREETFDIVALAVECYMQGWTDATDTTRPATGREGGENEQRR